MYTKIIIFINLIIAALLAGTSFGIWMGLNPTNYSPATYIEQQQHLVRSMHTLMVSMVIIATIVTLVSAFLQRKNTPVSIALFVAAVCFAACILISRFGNLPIQEEILTWNPSSPPDNWTELRDSWWSLHIVRTLAELIALVLISLASVLRREEL